MADIDIPGYEIYERVGRGGMASVFRARHLNLDREIAIKVMDPVMSADESFSERFIREARISAQLIHPHILQIYDVNHVNGIDYIAMEYLAGGDLGAIIHGEMPQRLIYQVMRQMTDALDYAFGHGYVHRDIKPTNIMLRSDNDFVLMDFGIARAMDSSTEVTQIGLMVGTPSYMSPEQARGEEVDGRSDLYSLAVLCYEMLTKRLPYESESAVSTAVKHLTEDIPVLEGTLEVYQPFFNRALAKNPDERYQGGAEMYRAFMDAGSGFGDHQVLTGARELRPEALNKTSDSGSEQSWNAEVTRVSAAASQPGSPAEKRPGRDVRKPSSRRSAGGRIVGLAVALGIVGALGYLGFDYWQAEQASYKQALREAEARAQREEQARLEAEALARKEEQTRLDAEALARKEEQARLDAEAQSQLEEQARLEAEAQARSEEQARIEAAVAAREAELAAEARARELAEAAAREERAATEAEQSSPPEAPRRLGIY